MKPITYVSNQARDYSDSLRKVHNFTELLGLVNQYQAIAGDATEAVRTGLTDPEAFWHDFSEGHAKEMRGEYSGDEWVARFGMIVMPEIIMRVGLIALHFGAPWGCAFIRLKEEGMLVKKRGQKSWHWQEPTP